MSLRLLELTLPGRGIDRVPAILEECPVVQSWIVKPETGDQTWVRILIEARHAEALSDLLVEEFGSDDGFRLLALPVEATVPAVEAREDDHRAEEARDEFSKQASRISREELQQDLAEASRLTPVFVVTVAISTVVAAVGLIRSDIAIIIGAMVIAPLLGPNVALSLASTLGDLELAKRSLRVIAAGVTTAAVLSLLMGVVLAVDPESPEIAARTRADLADVVLALGAGTAGALAFTSGVPAVVVGVMVAVALLPPLVVCGLLFGAGYGTLAMGAFFLVLTNVACVNLSAVATFLVQKIRPRTWSEAERAKRATRLAVSTWILMLALLLALMLLGQISIGPWKGSVSFLR